MKSSEEILLNDYPGFDVVAFQRMSESGIYFIHAPKKNISDVAEFIINEIPGKETALRKSEIKDVWMYFTFYR